MDGSGGAVYTFVPHAAAGDLTLAIRPATEHNGTTTAALSTTVRISTGSG